MDKTFFQGSHNKYISLEIILCLDNFNTCSSQIVKKRKNPFEVPPSSVFLCHENQHAKNWNKTPQNSQIHQPHTFYAVSYDTSRHDSVTKISNDVEIVDDDYFK